MHSLILIPIVVVAVVAWRLHRRWLREVEARRRALMAEVARRTTA